ncbi:LAETG motif-containing sortase-dependent surface protein [Streptomyces liangshanensis]|uniref:LAETG motif-containing sortase-dependent surface protein n=1 Tax=Streptomyces liangshanensis TaxID=2717324 RepID=UPI0036D9385B
MTVFNRSLRRPGALIAVAAAGVLGVGLSAGTASAHTPNWTVTCSSVTVDLKAYGHGDNPVNSVSLTADGASLINEKFGDKFNQTLELAKHSKPVELHLVVTAADGDQYNVDQKQTAKVCPGDEEPTPSPSTSAPSTPPATETPSATPSTTAPGTSTPTPTEEPTSSSPATVPSSQPSPAGDNLAETGSSSSTPIIAGAAAVVLVAGAGIMWAARKRRTAQG